MWKKKPLQDIATQLRKIVCQRGRFSAFGTPRKEFIGSRMGAPISTNAKKILQSLKLQGFLLFAMICGLYCDTVLREKLTRTHKKAQEGEINSRELTTGSNRFCIKNLLNFVVCQGKR